MEDAMAELTLKKDESAAQKIDPWNVQGAVVDGVLQEIDYTKLVKDFGSTLIDEVTLQRFEQVTGVPPHPLLRRGMFFSERYVLVSITSCCVTDTVN